MNNEEMMSASVFRGKKRSLQSIFTRDIAIRFSAGSKKWIFKRSIGCGRRIESKTSITKNLSN